MSGSISITVASALKAGAGFITAATSKEVIAMNCVEATYLQLTETDGYLNDETSVSVDNYDAIALGIGIGRNHATTALIRKIIDTANRPVVIDADGLHHLKSLLPVMQESRHPLIIVWTC